MIEEMQLGDAVIVRVTSSKYDHDHPAWGSQTAQLRERLRRLRNLADSSDAEGVPLLVETVTAEPDIPSKGVLDVAALVVASSELIRAAAVVIREWLKQDSTREVSIEVTRPEGSVAASGRGRDAVDTVYRALVTALREPEARQVDGEP